MTQNQIAYWRNVHDYEVAQHQLSLDAAKLNETYRSNVANERIKAQQARASLMQAQTSIDRAEEERRHNLIAEAEARAEAAAKYGRLKYDPNYGKDFATAVELFQIGKETFDWLLDAVFGGFKALKGGK